MTQVDGCPVKSTSQPSRRGHIVTSKAKRQRASRTNRPLHIHDLHSPRGRRIADLAGAYAEALGNPADIATQSEIVAAAELTTLAEEARALALANPATADLDAIVRVQGAADRAVRRLGVKPGAKRDTTPSLADIVARHNGGAAR
jgi:hypothetical protein